MTPAPILVSAPPGLRATIHFSDTTAVSFPVVGIIAERDPDTLEWVYDVLAPSVDPSYGRLMPGRVLASYGDVEIATAPEPTT